MKKHQNAIAAVAIALSLASCGTGKQATIADLGGEWVITSVDGKTLSAETTPFIGINAIDGSVYGNTGCNNLIGSLDKKQKPGTVDFSRLGSTRMMCADMTSERMVMGMLGKAKGYKLDGSTLTLTDANGNTVAELQKRNGKMSASSLQGEWSIIEVDGMPADGTESAPTIWFDTKEHLTHGNAGCNTFSGEYTVGKEQALAFGTMAVTLRMCDNMQFEQKVLKALDDVASFGKLPSGNAGLFDETGKLLIELAR